jgi:hypothetical protein
MNEHTGDGRDPRPRRSRRAGVLAAAVAGLALLLAACGGGGGSPAAAGSTAFQQALAYAQCMRSHGAPSWPDPDSQGNFISTKANRGDFHAPASANNACEHLLPDDGRITAAQHQQIISRGLRYSACMRSHGIPNFPDPSTNGFFSLGVIKGLGIDTSSPQFQSAHQTCMPILNTGGG